MSKTVLITGATDGIGLETARHLASEGHRLILHGRGPDKLERVLASLRDGDVRGEIADLSKPVQVRELATRLVAEGQVIDALVNNAGVLAMSNPVTSSGVDARLMVNTVAPWILLHGLLPVLAPDARVVNVASAGQQPVDLAAFRGERQFEEDYTAYAQSKLALTMWSMELGRQWASPKPGIVAVNPGSLLGTKMVKEAFDKDGRDVGIGVRGLSTLAVGPEPLRRGAYFDNDKGAGEYGDPHPDALDPTKCQALFRVLEEVTGSG